MNSIQVSHLLPPYKEQKLAVSTECQGSQGSSIHFIYLSNHPSNQKPTDPALNKKKI